MIVPVEQPGSNDVCKGAFPVSNTETKHAVKGVSRTVIITVVVDLELSEPITVILALYVPIDVYL